MNLSQLYYFRKLAQLQHYTNAAKELYITQPTLSDAIASLEGELGVSLFQKVGRNVRLTKYGVEFYEYINRSLNELEKGIAVVKEGAGELSGTVNIGSIYTIQGEYLPDVIIDYGKQKSADVKFNIYQGMTSDIIPRIKDGTYDVGFCSKVDEPDLFFVPILTQEVIAVVNKNHPLASRKELLLRELDNYPLISYHFSTPIGAKIQNLVEKHSNAHIEKTFDDEIILSGIVAIQPVVSIMLRTRNLPTFENLRAIRLPEVPYDFRLVYMVFNTKNYKNHAVESFIDYVAAFKSWSPRSLDLLSATERSSSQEDIPQDQTP